MKTLHLTLKKKWFDMIASGEKKEEYREVKPYWETRLWAKKGVCVPKFDRVMFANGYSAQSPRMSFNVEYIAIREGRSEWGAEPDKKYFVIKLGEKI